jgi:hypothetical protein
MAIPSAIVNDMAELIQQLRQLAPSFGRNEYWFRGHTQQKDWPLVASVHRYFDAASERQLSLQFQVGAVGRSPHCPAGDDFGSWLVLMQHYGLPTRLLDWTRSLTVAAYFAVLHEPVDEDAAIWLLAPERLNLIVPEPVEGICLLNGQAAPPQIRSLTEAAFREVPCASELYAVLSQDLDMRVLVQSGAFTIHASGSSLDQHPRAGDFLARFDIPASSRTAFQEELSAMGARRSLLFPDLHNLARELATRRIQNLKITERQL